MSTIRRTQPQITVGREPYWVPDEFDYEQLERYCDGGYCSVSIWQMFHDDRYRIVYKLGNGHFSTVWLAQDLQEKCYVALKFLTADQFGQSSEADVLRVLASSDAPSSGGANYAVSLLDSFDYESANGHHHVLVMPVSRPLMGLRPLKKIDFRVLARDLVKGLDSLHAAGIVHGDIHTSNIGYQMQNFSDTQAEELVPPQCHIVPPAGGMRPPYLVSRQEWSSEVTLDKGYRGQIIPQILDFGSAFRFSERKARLDRPVAVPECYRPPEHIFDRNFSQPMTGLTHGELNEQTDVWAMGATIFELAAGRSLLRPRWSSSPGAPYLQFDDRLAPRWRKKWEEVQKDSRSPKHDTGKFWEESLELIDSGPVSIGDHQSFKSFILDMVCLDPERRLGTQELLKHKYIADVSDVTSSTA